MNTPEDLSYTKDHEWVRDAGAGIYRVGITDYAQDALGDVVFVEIKPTGTEVVVGDAFGEAESTKSVSDLYSPISGTIKSVNEKLAEQPELVNSDPYGEGWMCEIELGKDSPKEELLTASQYSELIS